MRTESRFIGLGVLSAVAASLCCITPLLALLAGTSGLASSFSFLEPYRYVLIGATVLTLGVAWYQKLRTPSQTDCDCEADKPGFFQSKPFLLLVTVFAAVMLAFPSFSHVFYPSPKQGAQTPAAGINTTRTVEFSISGMTCSGCEAHVEQEVNALSGIVNAKASYDSGNAVVEFDSTKTNVSAIREAVLRTAYKVTKQKER
ncbi:mercuric transport protein MerTP [Pontibacter sp. FD36]|uniref:mercuric transport protein MerTP n=1 Tax=Pontibacter sp. FD36 TaxID=2789860 RepID=UPI0018AAA510|nr:mercuric transport protein MerTP [Pontibacter sp. FD36]MBF8962162.1 mercuric transport protein MerTP [Pontibacter sp. FD36]